MPKSFTDTRSYNHLDIQDLLNAQQIFHSDLFYRDNVVATAVGRYRKRANESIPRTLANSRVEEDSWPAVLVFVSKWEEPSEFATNLKRMYDFVPPFITLPDRRRVPTCVILVEDGSPPAPPLYQRLNFPTWMIGGGFPVVRRAQEEDRAGSLGCLVTDGANVFALTNRHVTGPPGSVIETFVSGERRRIGATHEKQVTRVDIDHAFPGFTIAKGWAMPVTFTNIDAGLIEVDDVNVWTAQLYGIGELGDLFDLSADTVSLDLIGEPVCAFGAASGELRGEIQGLFYRYRTVGSYGYVADLLIGPRADAGPLRTIPGDSGTIWCIESDVAQGARARRLRPIAMQWGGHVFGSGDARYPIALAASLSTVLRSLDVDLITNWNTGHSEYWGKAGHYKVAATACTLAGKTSTFGKFIDANAENIAFTDPDISKGNISAGKQDFVPLADVADIVWRSSRGLDTSNHFADMDQPSAKAPFKGKTLLDLTKSDANIDAAKWVAFYESIDVRPKYMGALPFRVWQMFDESVAHLKNGDVDKYLAAVGLMAHYVGDACQPLHVSFLHHGRAGHPEEEKVHSVYETDMLDRNAFGIVQKINAISLPPLSNVSSGFEAAKAVIELMRRTFGTLPPIDVINAYNETPTGKGRITMMWTILADRTAACMADGARTLMMLWESAFSLGGGPNVTPGKLVKIPQNRLMELYNDKTFVESKRLPDMVAALAKPAAAVGPAMGVKKKAAPAPKKRRVTRRPRASAT